MATYEISTTLPFPASRVYEWYMRPAAFERLTPPWEEVTVDYYPEEITEGEEVRLKIKTGPVDQHWIARIESLDPGREFVDVQEEGPFAKWHHRHLFEKVADTECSMVDEVTYELPAHALSQLVAGKFVRKRLSRMFAYRHRLVAQDLYLHDKAKLQGKRILISGSSGLIGSDLVHFLRAGGHEVVRLVRSEKKAGDDAIVWNPEEGFPGGTKQLEGFDAVIHLAGANLFHRWTDEYKQTIRSSRVDGTRTLCKALASLENKPEVLINGSAIGYYGETKHFPADEDSPVGDGFLADVGREWEEATTPAQEAGIRVVLSRTGIVLSPRGGALKMMLPIFKLCAGGRVGSGKQMMSWIAMDDMIGGMYEIMANKSIQGPVNLVSPNAVTNEEFTRTLDRVLSRPVGPPAPEFAIKAIFGELADEALLSSVHVEPKRLIEHGYQFFYPDLEEALEHLLGKSTRTPSPFEKV